MKIIETHIVFEEGQLALVAVLFESNCEGWVRATYCTNRPTSGYGRIKQGASLDQDLVRYVAAFGMNLPDDLKAQYFGAERKWDN